MSLSICEAFVYTDQALPIERCPAFRDQPPGSTATYNGKCYIFYNQQPTDFEVRRSDKVQTVFRVTGYMAKPDLEYTG